MQYLGESIFGLNNGGTGASNKYNAANNLSVPYMDNIAGEFVPVDRTIEVGNYKALVKYDDKTLVGTLYVTKPNQIVQIFIGTNDESGSILFRCTNNYPNRRNSNNFDGIPWIELNSSTIGDIGDGGDIEIDYNDIVDIINTVIPNTNQMANKAQLASKAVELANIVNLQVNLESEEPDKFNGSRNAVSIGVYGVLPQKNGGNGGYYLGVEEIDGEMVPYIEFGGE